MLPARPVIELVQQQQSLVRRTHIAKIELTQGNFENQALGIAGMRQHRGLQVLVFELQAKHLLVQHMARMGGKVL
jgi:hypothetical protein